MGSFYYDAAKITANMTLKEKIGQIAQIQAGYKCYDKTPDGIKFTESFCSTVREYGGIGAISGLLRSDPWTRRGYGSGIEIEEREHCALSLQNYLKENTRLGIPALIEVEASHGLQSLGSVMYPTGIGCAGSFDVELYEKMMTAIGREIRMSGNHIGFMTVIDLARDPRWGRSEECLGEDPFLASLFAGACIRGIKKGGALACAKHFCAAGAGVGGRNQADISIGERELRNIHLPTVKAAVDAGADLIMTAYNCFDGVPIHFNQYLLQDILRNELGYEGIIISDGGGVSFSGTSLGYTKTEAAAHAIKAGIELSLADSDCFTHLEEALDSGIVTMDYIDRACTHVIEKKYEVGLLGEKISLSIGSTAEYVKSGECQTYAYEMAASSICLCKNNGILPLSKDAKICLIGENADNIYYLLGDYTSERKPDEGTSIFASVNDNFKNVIYSRGWSFDKKENINKALEDAKECDVIVLCVGGSSVRNFEAKYLDNGAVESSKQYMDCGEGRDLASLELHSSQLEAIRRLKQLGKPIVTVAVIGRATVLTEVNELSDALLITWYPGQEGGRAIADIISGNVNPNGKLPVTLPVSVGCLPVHSNYGNGYCDVNNGILYPFGYGLSYSTFKYSNIESIIDGDKLIVSAELENTSDIAGKEAAQLYIQVFGDSVKHTRELAAIDKRFLCGHECVKLKFVVNLDNFGIMDNHVSIGISVGGSSVCSECMKVKWSKTDKPK